jgi:outer membrane protein TolC
MEVLKLISIALAFSSQAQTPLSANDALKLAAQNRPALKSAKLGIEQARATAKAMGAYAPTMFLAGASSRSELGPNDQDLQVSQPLDLFGRRKANARIGDAGVQISLAEYVSAASDLQSEVLLAFAGAVSNQHQTEVAAELLKISEGLLAATKRRFDEGKVAETQVTRATIELARAKQAAVLTDAELNASLQTLAGLLGTDKANLKLESDAKIRPLDNPEIETRAELQLLQAQIQLAQGEAEGARVSNRPELSALLVRSPWSNDPGYFAGRLQLSWALSDHGRAKNETKAALHRSEAIALRLQDATLKARAELSAAQVAVKARESQILEYERILAAARTLVAKSQTAYSEGFGTQVDVLEATRALREVEQELVEARYQLSLAVVAQYKASGFLSEVLK